jgi:hypothetical protein
MFAFRFHPSSYILRPSSYGAYGADGRSMDEGDLSSDGPARSCQ